MGGNKRRVEEGEAEGGALRGRVREDGVSKKDTLAGERIRIATPDVDDGEVRWIHSR